MSSSPPVAFTSHSAPPSQYNTNQPNTSPSPSPSPSHPSLSVTSSSFDSPPSSHVRRSSPASSRSPSARSLMCEEDIETDNEKGSNNNEITTAGEMKREGSAVDDSSVIVPSSSDSKSPDKSVDLSIDPSLTIGTGSGPPEFDSPLSRRVKVYQLNDLGQWDDRGTGFATLLHPGDMQFTIVVKSDPALATPNDTPAPAHTSAAPLDGPITPNILLHHKIVEGVDYQRQGETILTWCESSTGLDLALSFQDQAGCSYVWNLITSLQMQSQVELVVSERHALQPEEEAMLQLPEVSLENLPAFNERLTVMNTMQKDFMATALLKDDALYLRQLFDLFYNQEIEFDSDRPIAERRKSLENLEALFHTMKNIFLLNDPGLIELLLSDDYLLYTAGMLEYDPAYSAPPADSVPRSTFQVHNPPAESSNSSDPLAVSSSSTLSAPAASSVSFSSSDTPVSPPPPRSIESAPTSPLVANAPAAPARPLSIPDHDYHTHRRFLSSSRLQTVLGLPDYSIEPKIHQSFRLTYAKDVLLLRYLDDATQSTFSSMIFLNNVTVINCLADQREWNEMLLTVLFKYAPVSSLPGAYEQAFQEYQQLKEISATPVKKSNSIDTDADTEADEPSQKSVESGKAAASNASTIPASSPPTASPVDDPLAAVRPSRCPPPADEFNTPVSYERREVLFTYVQEMVLLAKNVQVEIRDKFYRLLCDCGLVHCIERCMSALVREGKIGRVPDRMKVWIICSDILTSLCMHDPSLLRAHASASILRSDNPQGGRAPLMALLFELLSSNHLYLGMGHQLSCILRLVLDPEMMNPSDKDDFLHYIYTAHMPTLSDTLRQILEPLPSDPNRARAVNYWRVQSAVFVIELLTFCAVQHPAQFFHFLTHYHVLTSLNSILLMFKRPELRCSIIRFIRTCLLMSRTDPALVEYPQKMLESHLFESLLKLFVDNGARYNLLNSVILELINYIRAENVKPLVSHIAWFWLPLVGHTHRYVKVFEEIKELFYENEKDTENQSQAPDSQPIEVPSSSPVSEHGRDESPSITITPPQGHAALPASVFDSEDLELSFLNSKRRKSDEFEPSSLSPSNNFSSTSPRLSSGPMPRRSISPPAGQLTHALSPTHSNAIALGFSSPNSPSSPATLHREGSGGSTGSPVGSNSPPTNRASKQLSFNVKNVQNNGHGTGATSPTQRSVSPTATGVTNSVLSPPAAQRSSSTTKSPVQTRPEDDSDSAPNKRRRISAEGSDARSN